MTGKDRIEAYLADQDVAFERHHHPSAAFTAQEIAALEHIPGRLVAKVVMAFSDERLVMLVVPAPYWVDLEKAAAELGSSTVRLAGEDEFGPYFPDCELGATPPFGNLYGVPVYVDRALMRERTIYFQEGTHSDVIEMECREFLRLADAVVVDLARGQAA